MSKAWQPLRVGASPDDPGFRGLLTRRQQLIDDVGFAIEQQNIDCYGGSLGKRAGSQLVTGHGSYTTAARSAGATIIPVADGLDYANGQTFDLLGDTYQITAHSGTQITITPGLTQDVPAGSPILMLLPGPGAIDDLIQANFRDGTRYLLASIAGREYHIQAASAPAAIVEAFPTTTTSGVWVAGVGPVTNPNGLQIGDYINITGFGDFQVTGLVPGSGVVTVNGTPAPGAGVTVTYMPSRTAAAENDVMTLEYANMIFRVSGKRATTGIPIPPIKVTKVSGVLTAQRMGVKPPVRGFLSITPQTVVGGGLTLTATYQYRIRYYNSATGQESEGGPVQTVTLVGANNSVAIGLNAANGSPDPQVDQIRIYRTYANASGVWYRVLEVENPIGTPITAIPDPTGAVTYNDLQSDVELGTQMRDFLDLCPPDTLNVLSLWPHANRLIAVDYATNSIVFSDQPDIETGFLKGEAWPVNNQIFINYDDGDKNVGIAAFFDSILIFKNHSIWRILGIPPNIEIQPVHFRQDLTSVGTRGQKSIVVDHGDILYLGFDAVYQLNRREEYEGFQSRRISMAIDEAIGNSDDDVEDEITPHAVYFRDKRQYRLWLTTSRAMVLQFEAGLQNEPMGWGAWRFSGMQEPDGSPSTDTGASSMTASCVAQLDNLLVRGIASPGIDSLCYVGTDNGHVLQLDTCTADFGGLPYEVRFKTTRFAPGGRGGHARFRALDLFLAILNSTTFTLEVMTDRLGTFPNVTVTETGGPLFFPRNIDMKLADLPTEITSSWLGSAPGQWHQWSFVEQGISSMYRLLGWVYWFQQLSELTGPRVNKQTVLPNTI